MLGEAKLLAMNSSLSKKFQTLYPRDLRPKKTFQQLSFMPRDCRDLSSTLLHLKTQGLNTILTEIESPDLRDHMC